MIKKKSGRYAVKTTSGSWVNGEDKTKLLLTEGLIKVDAPKVAEPEPEVQEQPAEEAQEEQTQPEA